MSALARHFIRTGKQVGGYDRTQTILTSLLEAEGMDIHYCDDPALIPGFIRENLLAEGTLYIYTPAIPKDNLELNYLKKKGVRLFKRAEVLGILSRSYKTMAVAGSHGKSTVSAMITQIFLHEGPGCNAFLGAVSKSMSSNYAAAEDCSWAVMEADEFDRSFLHLAPFLALVTSMDSDHLDIYSGMDDLRSTFTEFLNKVEPGSTVILKQHLDLHPEQHLGLTVLTYSLDHPSNDFYARNIQTEGMGYCFDLITPQGCIGSMRTMVPGLINVENAVGASAMAISAGLSFEVVKSGIASFEGLIRRFDVRFNRSGVVYMDDYAHHPNEISALLDSVRRLFPGRKLTGIFQPHLYTRTRDLASEFGLALSKLDELILLDIYPARELPIPGVGSSIIFNHVDGPAKEMKTMKNLPEALHGRHLEILLTIGAGNIDQLVDPVTQYLEQHVP